MKITATLEGVDTLACDICGNAVGDYDVQRFRITLTVDGKTYEIDLCKNDRGALEALFANARLRGEATGRKPRAPVQSQPPRPGARRLRNP